MPDYQRFLEIIDDKDTCPDRSISDMYEVILKWVEGGLERHIVPSDVMVFMKDLISDADYEQLSRKEEREGPISACRFLFVILKRRHADWPLKFLKALYKHHENIGPKLVTEIAPELLKGKNRGRFISVYMVSLIF